MAKIKIAIDAGHGSKTAGKRTPPLKKNIDINHDGKIDLKKGTQYQEHYAAVGIASRLYSKLKKEGFEVVKSGWNDANAADDKDVSLSDRQKKIKNAGCDYSISIHFNAYGDGRSFNSANGVAVYIHNENPADSRHLAEYVLKELTKGTPQKNRGIQTAKLALCNCNSMGTQASILCEIAFMTNEREAHELMANESFWEECAGEITRAVLNYCDCGNQEKPVDGETVNVYHTVVAGDTLSELAAKYETTVLRLVRLNELENPNEIQIGQKLLIRKYIRYIVKKGDTLSKISQTYLGSAGRYEEIKNLNGLASDTIFIGQVLKLPLE
jgi:N-acetylmuramoyl-L-alanine amidase